MSNAMTQAHPVVMVVDDDRSVRESLAHLVRSMGLNVETFGSAQEFLTRGRHDGAACLVLDVTLPGLSGLDLQRELARIDVRIPTIFISGQADIPMTVLAMKGGAVEFLTKPCRDEDLLTAIDQAIQHGRQQLEQRRRADETTPSDVECRNVLREEIDKTSMFEEIVGASPPLRIVLSQVSRVAPTDSTVLITGETGTGKELVARAIHRRSPRSAGAFVAVNCAAIPSSLIASELFGHEKGAFTGALQRRLGRFELADGGTIFLDEVGELPAETQIMLLRVLQEREFERVGGSGPIRVNVRVIAATNRDLPAAVADGTVRSDLFYRLNVFPLDVPALRERRSDVPLLAEYFVHRYATRAGKRICRLSKETAQLLQAYDWPGNIRELQNVIERAVIVCDSDTLSIDARWLSGRPPRTPPTASLSTGTLAAHEKDAIEAALTETKGRVSGPFGAATRVGVPASTLESKIRALNIDKRCFKSGS